MTLIRHENSINDILHDLQKRLKSAKVKTLDAEQHFCDYDEILSNIKMILPPSCTVTMADQVTQIGDRYYIVATARFWLGDRSIESTAWVREPAKKKDVDEQFITASCSMQARKMALCGLFAIENYKVQ